MAELFPEGFLPFLPKDVESFDSPESEQVVEEINTDLEKLLNISCGDFWRVVQEVPSLTHCLDSFLRFRRRSFEIKSMEWCQLAAASRAYQQVLLVLIRLVTDQGGPGVPDVMTQAKILYDNWVLDIPKILDVCSIYSTDNRELVVGFLKKVFFLQPKYLEDLAGLVSVLVENLHELELSCWNIMPETQMGSPEVLASWPDALKYVQDVCVNLSLILELYHPCGAFLMREGGSLLARLARIHDFLIPDLAAAFGDITMADGTTVPTVSSHGIVNAAHLTYTVIQRLCFLLLQQAYLLPDLNSDFKSSQVAEGRGEAIVTAVLAIAQLDKQNLRNTLLHQLNKKYSLGRLLYSSIQNGVVWIDDHQYEYLCMLMGYDKLSEEMVDSGGPSSSSSSLLKTAKDPQVALSICKIKEILPDHSDGYLAKCLELCGSDPSRVIQGLLEGSLPPENEVDSSHGKSGPQDNLRDKPGSSQQHRSGSSSVFPASFLSIDSASDSIVNPVLQTSVRDWAQVAVGPGKPQMNKSTAKMLASLDRDIKGLILRRENALLEYEDEYDDSFDDLATMGADGMADAEGDGQVPILAGTASRADIKPRVAVRSTEKQHQSKSKQQAKKTSEKGTTGKKLWLLNGRIYNYYKEGAREVQSQADAERIIRGEGEEIHGLGPGGNKPLDAQDKDECFNNSRIESNGGAQHSRQSGSRGRGRGRSGRNNSSAGNHHRKERALRKGG